MKNTPPMPSADTAESTLFANIRTLIPDGQVKFPHPWPPQIPPGRTAGL